MKYKNILNFFSFTALTALVIAGCKKPGEVAELGNAGSSFVKIMQAPTNAFYFEPFTDTRSFTALSLRRDANSNAELNNSITVTLKLDTAALSAYNDDNGTSFELLPDSLFTIGSGFTKKGDLTYEATFAGGDFNKDFIVSLNGAKWDLAHVYALPFKIENPGGLKISSDYGNLISFISIKNQYDGKYTLEGAFYHPTSSPGYDAFTIDAELHTSGPNSVKIYIPDFGGYYGPGLFSGELNAFGAQEPEITIDPVTNKATVQNSYSGAVTFYTMAPGYDSHYDPATKKIYVKYGYNYSPGPVFNPATNREWTYVFTYVGPR